MKRARGRRGVAYVEVLVIVGVVVTLGLLSVTLLGNSAQTAGEKEAKCIESFSCNGGGGGQASNVADLATRQVPGSAGGAGGGSGLASVGRGVWNFGKGFVLEGLDMVVGTVRAVAHPVDTVKGVAFAAAHPGQAWNALKGEWQGRGGAENAGRAVFEVATVVGPAAFAKLGKAAEVSATLGEVGKTADAARVASEVAEATKVAEAERAAEVAAGRTAQTIEDMTKNIRRAEQWADDNWDHIKELPPANVPGLSYSGFSTANLGSISEKGLLSGESLGRASGLNASKIWFKQGQPFYAEGPAVVMPTERLEQIGGVHGVGLAGQPGVVTVATSAAPTGIPFDELAVVVSAGNGYVIPVHVPPQWRGPPLPVVPGWKP